MPIVIDSPGSVLISDYSVGNFRDGSIVQTYLGPGQPQVRSERVGQDRVRRGPGHHPAGDVCPQKPTDHSVFNCHYDSDFQESDDDPQQLFGA